MLDINEYKIFTQRKINNLSRKWYLVLIFIIIGSVFINNYFKYYKYYSNYGDYKDDYIYLYVLIDDLDNVTKNNEIIIENNIFAYRIKEISEDNIYLNNSYYKELKLSVEEYQGLENDVVDIKIVIEESSLLEYVYKTIWR